MGHFDAQDTEDGKPLYCSAPQSPHDIIWPGSDTEQTPQAIHEKRLRYEKHAQRYLRGQLPVLQSASLRGPLGNEWVNPWRYRPRPTPDWFQPASKEKLFTRANVMRWAADAGLGHLAPKDALARCKAAAEAQGSRAAESVHDSVNTEDFGSSPDIGYQSEDSQDPLSQGDDLALFRSDPVRLESNDGNGEPSNRATKRPANLQWLKGSYISKRARWDDPLVPSPSPVVKLPKGRGRQRHDGSPRARTSTKAQFPTNTASKRPYSLDDKNNGLGGVWLQQQEEDLDELGDISRGTTLASAVDFPGRSHPKSSTTAGLNHDFEKIASPPDELAITTPAYSADTVESRSIKVQSLPHSLRDLGACDVDVLGDDSFVTEVAPSSGNVEKFKYRKRRKRSRKRASAESELDVPDRMEDSSKPRENPMEPAEQSSNFMTTDADFQPERLPNEELSLESETRLRVSSLRDFPPTETPPIENTAVAEKEPSTVRSRSDSSWVMINDTDSPPGASPRSSQKAQSLIGSKVEGLQSPATPRHPEKHDQEEHTQEEHVDSHPPPPVRDDDITESCTSDQTGLALYLNEDIQDYMKSPSAEEIIQSQIRAEMGVLMDVEESVDGDMEEEKKVSPKSSSQECNRATQNSGGFDGSSQSHLSQPIASTEDVALAGCDAAKADVGNSTPRVYSQEQDSYQGRGLQSPWAADPSQLVQGAVYGEHEQEAIDSRNVGTPDRWRMAPGDSAQQHLARPQTPDNDGIIPFKNFMTPTPSPKLIRTRPSFSGLPTTQTLVEATTSNPWVKDSGRRRSKKRVSFGLPEEEGLEVENTPQETPLSPPPPPTSDWPGEDFDDGTTTVNQFQKHFAAVGRVSQRARQRISSPFPRSPAVSAMADAFIEADRETSLEQGRRASPSRHLQPMSSAMTNIPGDNEGSGTLGETRSVIDLDGFLGEAGGFLEEWSVELELKKATEGGKRGGNGEERRRMLGGVWS